MRSFPMENYSSPTRSSHMADSINRALEKLLETNLNLEIVVKALKTKEKVAKATVFLLLSGSDFIRKM